jgi:hypothetical protein
MAESSAAPVGTTLVESSAERRFELNRYYISGVDTPWLWEYLRWGESKSLSFSLTRLAPSGAPARIAITLQGVSDYPVSPDHHIRASLNGTYLGEVSWDGKLGQGLQAEVPARVLREGENALELENLPTRRGHSPFTRLLHAGMRRHFWRRRRFGALAYWQANSRAGWARRR